MQVIITYYKDNFSDETETYLTELPLKFGFGSFNGDQIVKGISRKIFLKNIISIKEIKTTVSNESF